MQSLFPILLFVNSFPVFLAPVAYHGSNPALVGGNGMAETLMAIACSAISLMLIVWTRHQKTPFQGFWVILTTAMIALGSSHWMALWALWQPLGGLTSLITLMAGGLSLGAAVWLAVGLSRAIARSGLTRTSPDRAAEPAECQKTDPALQQSEGRFRIDFEQFAVGLVYVSLEGTFLRVNQRFCDITGYTQEELQQLTFQDITHSEDLAADLAQLKRLLAGEIQTYSLEKRYLHSQGAIIWITLTVSLARKLTGEPDYLLGVVEDISRRKQAEETLKTSEERLRLALQAANQGLYDLNVQTGEVIVSPEYATMLGYDPESFVETSARWIERLHPDDREPVSAIYHAYVAGEIPEYRTEFRQCTQEGDWKWILSLGKIIAWDDKGQPLRMLGTHTDISDRKAAELERQHAESLRKELKLLESVLEVVLAGYWDWDIPGDREYLSPTFKRMFGYEDDELRNAPASWQQIIFAEDLLLVFAAVNQHFQSHGQVPFSQEVRYHHKNGSTVWVICSGKVIEWDADGNPSRMIGCHIDITNRKLAEQALQEKEERWQLALEGSNEGIWDWNLQTNAVFFSARWKEMLGYADHEIPNHLDEWALRVHPDDLEWVTQVIQDHFDGKTPFYQSEHRVRCKDGSYKWILDRGKAIWDPDGQPVRMVGSHTDISDRRRLETERQQAEAQILALNNLQQAILNSADYSIISTNAEGVIQTFNAAAQRMLGYTAAEVVGRATSVLIHDGEEIQARAKLLSAKLGQEIAPGFDVFVANTLQGNTCEAEWSYVRKDGSHFPVFLSITALRDSQGEIIGFLSIAKDITQQKQMEAQLRQVAAHLATAQRIAHLGSWEMDLPTQAITWSEEVFHIFGWDPAGSTPVYDAVIQAIYPDDRDRVVTHIQQSVDRHQPMEQEYRLLRPDGSVRHILSRNETMLDADGDPIRLVGTVLDISDRKQAQEALQETNDQLMNANLELGRATRLKDEFLANMSHELRTPLNAILGMSEGLQECVFGSLNERQLKAIATIERSGRHLLELINDILDVSKIEAGKLELSIGEVSISSLCDISLTFVRQMALKKNLCLTLQLGDRLNHLYADERRLRQILINLLNNAVKFTPEGGTITLTVKRQIDQTRANASPSPCWIEFSIRDTGIGIAPEQLSTLFQPFVQIDSSLNRQYSGTGLGLALVRRLTELHGGEVRVESEPGQGSCFTVRIPEPICPVPDIAAPAPAFSVDGLPRYPNVPIQSLIIEDSPTAAEQISRYLWELGIGVTVMVRGEGVLDLVVNTHVDLIILDILLPDRSGWDLLTQLKANPQTRGIPVIVISVVDDRPRGLALGASDYLVKPVHRQQVRDALAKLQLPTPQGHRITSASAPPSEQQTAQLAEPTQRPLPLLLLVDDNAANLETISSYLSNRGFSLIQAGGGSEGIEMARSHHPDLILMDIQMPGMDGLEAIRRIRQDPEIAPIPIIALTALAMPGDRETCLNAGANEYCPKPVKLKDLTRRIQTLLQQFSLG